MTDDYNFPSESAARNKRARMASMQQIDAIDTLPPSDSKQAQPDLVPRMTSRERHGHQILRNHMQQMAAISEASERATNVRFEASLTFQYDCLIYKHKQMLYRVRCQEQIQKNSDITTDNIHKLAIWEKTGGFPPELREPEYQPVPMPTPPQDPATKRAGAHAAAWAAQIAQVTAEAAAQAAVLAEDQLALDLAEAKQLEQEAAEAARQESHSTRSALTPLPHAPIAGAP